MTSAVDLLIVGGGINGAGIARDAAGRGLSTMLVEQDDLAAHTSSASTKLIHGGLRYLEYHEFRLVRESLQERERLMAIAPHLIAPLDFFLPHAAGQRPAWMIRAGLFLYDHLARRRRLPGSRAVTAPHHPGFAVLKPGYRRGFTYADCRVDDSRLVVLNALDAAERGATIRSYTRLLSARRAGPVWQAEIEDRASGARTIIAARAIVNAAGPWVSELLEARLARHDAGRIRLVKGSHIIVPRRFEGDYAFILQNPDGRILFAIPYQDRFTLIGTTDIPYDGHPADVAISEEEVAYLCANISGYFRTPVTPADVVHSFSGLRALHDDGAANASAVTRDYLLTLDGGGEEPPLLSVFGGKITTYRRLAEHAMAKLLPALGRPLIPGWTGRAPLPGGDMGDGRFDLWSDELVARHPGLPPALLRRLGKAYGTRVETLLGGAATIDDLGADLGGGLTEAEVDYLAVHEWARQPDDILWRRSKLGLHVPPGTAARVAQRLGREAAPPVPQQGKNP
ncbi:glycerol-3-phosphate dehydrogenase [Sphingomonas histidinilytica]|uniref:glycerol-3-phosphate dehydrogenase n=1 Tax=Rhizorhabdus histidinilytica TaxID=439228 RepID=UPI001ADD0EF3|nr:glycerol-3-phosphate dehydrogenase [Rhizorhabdus histidinilytica]MBO9380351.1 glycerol-3-phosphate dehydrogenase [Rhizorhabdus histidinilytica]